MSLFSKRNLSLSLPIVGLLIIIIWPLTGQTSDNWQLIICSIALALTLIYMFRVKD
jgi:uncharacterized protein (DUF58 family)